MPIEIWRENHPYASYSIGTFRKSGIHIRPFYYISDAERWLKDNGCYRVDNRTPGDPYGFVWDYE